MTLRELAAALGADFDGTDGEQSVSAVVGLAEADAGCVTYAEDEYRLKSAESSPALAVIVPEDLRTSSKPLLRVPKARLAFARALMLMTPTHRPAPGIHPTAIIGEGVTLGAAVHVGAYVVIEEGTRIGRGSELRPFTYIGADVVIGEECILHPGTMIYSGTELGDRVKVQAGCVLGSPGFGYVWDGEQFLWVPHLGRVVIEDDVELGALVAVDRGTTRETRIGRGTKIDNLVQIAHNVTIGEHTLVAGQAGLSGSVTLGKHVILAGQVGVGDHITMGDGAAASGGAIVVRDVPAGVTVHGAHTRPLNQQMRIDAASAHLPDLLREVRELKERVAELEREAGEESTS
jgi:UDP-3-O-[3-hydroxymyristoyl] glucosamine N-acyltransferase